MKKIVN